MWILLHIQSAEGSKHLKKFLLLNSNITATQQSVLRPHRGQKNTLSCSSGSPSHQNLNRCVVNPGGRQKSKIKDLSCTHFPFNLYCKRRIKESQLILSPTGPGNIIQSQRYSRYFAKNCPTTFPLQFHLCCHYKF